MKTIRTGTTALFLAEAGRTLQKQHLPRIIECLEMLSDEEIWWRPNPASNSIGNLVLHLAGNVRQWIVSGLGGAPDHRRRDLEFSERGPLPRRDLILRLRQTVDEACRVLARLSSATLARRHSIQKFHVTGMHAVTHIVEHFAYHTGQIIYVTKLKRARDLGFTRLPASPSARSRPPRPARARRGNTR